MCSQKPDKKPLLIVIYFCYQSVFVTFYIKYYPGTFQNADGCVKFLYFEGCFPI